MNPWIPAIVTLTGAGLVAGSFLGTLVLRLPTGRPVVLARSQCDSCGRTLSPWQLIPILSWIMQKGVCRRCGGRIPLLYPAIELLAAGIGVWAYLMQAPLWPSLLLGWTLLALAIMDLRTFKLSDALTLPLVVAGLVVSVLFDPRHNLDHAMGALAGWGVFVALGYAYHWLRHRQGLGAGDAKLLGAGGAWLGWQSLPSVLLLAATAALLVTSVQSVLDGRPAGDQKIAFGAYLSLGIWIVWLYGPIRI